MARITFSLAEVIISESAYDVSTRVWLIAV